MGKPMLLFYEICRLCLNKPGICDIFDKDNLPPDIFMCTGVRVYPSDNLPQKICARCLEIVNCAKELRVIATENDTNLKSLFDHSPAQDCESVVTTTYNNMSNTENMENTSCHKKQAAEDEDNLITTQEIISSTTTQFISVRKDLFDPVVDMDTDSKMIEQVPTNITEKDQILSEKVNEETQCNNKSNIIQEVSTNMIEKKRKLNEDKDEFRCDLCSKQFDKWKKLYLHQRLHNKSIACPLDACGKKFSTKGDLQKHLRVHTGEKPFSCDICSRSFSQKASLKAHQESVHKNPEVA